MTYIADPANPALPLDSDDASGGAAELRALKGYLQGLISGGGSFESYAWQGFRNRLWNSDFRFQFRPALAASTGGMQVERWGVEAAGSPVFTQGRIGLPVGQQDIPGNPKFYYNLNVTNGGDPTTGFLCFRQRIGGVETLNGSQATLGVWLRSVPARSLSVNLYQVFGTGGAPSAAVIVGAQKVLLTTSWQFFNFTFSVPSILGKTLGSTANTDFLQVEMIVTAGSVQNSRTDTLGIQTGSFDIALPQFEKGGVATPFEWRPDNVELAGCQEYAVIYGPAQYCGTGNNISASTSVVNFTTANHLRKVPVPSIVGSGGPPTLLSGAGAFAIGSFGTVYWSPHTVTSIIVNTSVGGMTVGAASLPYTDARYIYLDSDLG